MMKGWFKFELYEYDAKVSDDRALMGGNLYSSDV